MKYKKGDEVIIYRNSTIMKEEGQENHYPLNEVLIITKSYTYKNLTLYSVTRGLHGIYEGDLRKVKLTKLEKVLL